MIQGHGRDSSIMLVGDYGSDEDFANGRAITGFQDSILRRLFKEVKWNVDNTYRTLLIKDRLTYNGKAKKKKEEAIKEAMVKADYYSILNTEILTFEPKVIVPLGNLTLKYLTDEYGISKFRGSILPLKEELKIKFKERNIRVIPTLSPIELNANYTAQIYCRLDFQKIVDNKDRVDPLSHQELIWIARSVDDFRTYINRVRNCDFLTVDIETFCGIPDCIGFSADGKEGVCVPLILDEKLDHANQIALWSIVSKVLYSEIPKANQNIKYDQTILERFRFKLNNIVFDTQLAAGLIYPELPKNLGFLASIYTEMPYFKDEGKEFDPAKHSRDRRYIYNAKDAIATWQIVKKQQEELLELGLKPLYYGKTPERETEDNPLGVIKLYHIYRKIDQRGIQIDDTKRQNLRIKYQILLDIHEAQLRYMTQLKLNVNSPKQIGELIYEELKFPVRKKTSPLGVSGYNTEEEVLEALVLLPPGANKREFDGIEIVELILFCRKLYRTLQTLDTPTHLDNRMRFNYNLSGTENGRTSASKTFDEYFYVTSQGKVEKKKLGHSPQTFGKHGFRYKDQMYGQDLREIFVPSPGRILVEGDLSQAEARVDAVLASDFDILPRFDDETGIHRLTASWVYSCSPAEIIKGSEQYHIGKTIRHAAERNMQPALLSMLIHKPLQFCTDLLQTFNSTQPKIKAIFHTDIRNFVRKNRFLVAPNGRRRDFFGRMDDSLINEAISFLPQAIVSDQMKFTMVPFYEDDNEFPFLYEGHDAIMAEILPDQLQTYAERFKRIAERKINFNTCSLSRDYELTIPVEITTSENNWADMKVLK